MATHDQPETHDEDPFRPVSGNAHPAHIATALLKLDEADRIVLRRLLVGPPVGRVANASRKITWEKAQSPIDRLLALGLLRARDDNTVVLPRDVALVLRRDPAFRSGDSNRRPAAWAKSAKNREDDWRPVLQQAIEADLWVDLAYAEEDGTVTRVVVRVLYVAHGTAYLVRKAGARLNLPVKRIVSAHGLDPVIINDPLASEG